MLRTPLWTWFRGPTQTATLQVSAPDVANYRGWNRMFLHGHKVCVGESAVRKYSSGFSLDFLDHELGSAFIWGNGEFIISLKREVLALLWPRSIRLCVELACSQTLGILKGFHSSKPNARLLSLSPTWERNSLCDVSGSVSVTDLFVFLVYKQLALFGMIGALIVSSLVYTGTQTNVPLLVLQSLITLENY